MSDLIDKIIPPPDEAATEEKIKSELKAEGFPIEDFSRGIVFRTLLKVSIKLYAELVKLAREILNNSNVSTAQGAWLELKAKDYSKQIKLPSKTEGKLKLSRNSSGNRITIPKDYIFYALDSDNNKMKYINIEKKVMEENEISVEIKVIAELAGSKYNVLPGQITRSLIHIEGIDNITNTESWITSEGTDKEDEEIFRSRCLNSWADLSIMPIKDKYKNAAESVSGVLLANVDCEHPRGQGTIDVTVTSISGNPTDKLLSDVTAALEKIAAPYDNILVKAAEAVPTDITVKVIIPDIASEEGVEENTRRLISNYFTSNRASKNANELYLADLIYLLRGNLTIAKNIKITAPTADIILDKGKIITFGTINVTVERG